MTSIMAFEPTRRTNASLMHEVAKLGYIKRYDFVLDPTYGEAGGFWKHWKPMHLTHHDLKLDGVDFRDLPYSDDHFDVVVFDPPYKLNGTPDPDVDARYGVDEPTNWRERMALMSDGWDECLRVLKNKGYLMVKCQDQVCSGKVRWQTDFFTRLADRDGCRKVDAMFLPSFREQPAGRSQKHSRRNYSTLLIFKKGESVDDH